MIRSLLLFVALAACDDKFTPPDDSADDPDGDGYAGADDCAEGDPAVHPGAEELCDGVDNDCDGDVDGDAVDAALWYADEDGDGAPGAASTVAACAAPEGYGPAATDCDDTDPVIHPGAGEVCGGVDEDCDGLLDADDPDVDLSTALTWYPDADGDGYGDDAGALESCSAPEGHVTRGGDCDEADPAINPETWWYADADADGYGDPGVGVQSCVAPATWLRDNTDCDDQDERVSPSAQEVCDAADNDCDGLVDDEDASVDPATLSAWYVDNDGDGYGDAGGVLYACEAPPSTVPDASDCDDTTDLANPSRVEVCDDGLDNDCDGTSNGCGIRGTLSTTDADASWYSSFASDFVGQALDIVGDIDGDGYDDAILGSYGRDDNGSGSGAVYLVFGASTPVGDDVTNLSAWWGEDVSDYLGFHVSGVGDMDADGYADYLMGAYGDDTFATSGGAGYLVYGGTRLSGVENSSAVDATFGGESTTAYAGHGLGAAGDVDGDGYDDALVGAYGASSARGMVTLIYGGPRRYSGASRLSDHPCWTGENTNDYLGYRYSMASGDFDGDGLSDLALGAYRTDGAVTGTLGTTYILYGDTSRWSGCASVSDADAQFEGVDTGGDVGFGYATAGLGDFDGDGVDDLAVGGHFYDSATVAAVGSFWLFLGDSGRWSGGTTADADMSFEGVNRSDYLGRDVEGPGDLDGDGVSEVVSGSYGWDGAYSDGGAAVIWYGRAAATGAYVLTDADARVEGAMQSANAGYATGGGGDMNGDGLPDLLVGAFGDNTAAGSVYLFLGGSQ